jgi:hypothetical protein
MTRPLLLVSICAIVFGACVLIGHAQAQYVPPPTPLPPPVFQSVQPLYRASTEIHAHHAYNTKRRSRICGYAASE